MKIETQYLEDHQSKLVVEFEPELLDQAKRQAAKNIARKTKIPGFRPGKIPFHIVQRYVGDEFLTEEAIKVLISTHYPSIVDQAKIEPYGPGRLEKIISTEPLILEFCVPLKAEVQLGDYRSIRIPYNPPSISEEDVVRAIDVLRGLQAIEEPVTRPIQPGDRVYIRIHAKRMKTEDLPETTIIRERNYSLIIPTDLETPGGEWPFPGFSKELLSMKVGEEKTFLYTYPDDSEYVSLRNKTVEFNVHIDEVKSRTLPELNDEFAQSIEEGKYATIEELKNDVREKLQGELIERYHEDYDDEILTKIISISTIKYPPQLLEEEIEDTINSIKMRLQSQGTSFEVYLKSKGISENEYREEIKPDIETRLKKYLVLYEIAKAEDISINEDELKEETQKSATEVLKFLPNRRLNRTSSQDLLNKIAMQSSFNLFVQHTLERLRQIAKSEVTEYSSSTEKPEEEKLHIEPIDLGSNHIQTNEDTTE